MTTLLAPSSFLSVVEHTPLVSIDLIVSDTQGNHLLGRRKNAPARGFWFVPGGRIRKNEHLKEAFRRITQDELGVSREFEEATLLGVYEHFYEDNFADAPGISTHYVVMAYKLQIAVDQLSLPVAQHDEYRWAPAESIVGDHAVHGNSRCYFQNLDT